MSWGRGNGHITRLLAIGRAFRDAGWHCTLLGHDVLLHSRLAADAGLDAEIRYPPAADASDPWTNWADPSFLSSALEFDRSVLEEVGPDRVVNDNRLSMLISCSELRIPIVTLCQDNQLPDYRFPDTPLADIWTTPALSVNDELRRRGLPLVGEDVRELFGLGRIAVPSSPEWDPLPERTDGLDIVYTGALTSVCSSSGGDDLLFYRTVGRIDGDFVAAFGNWPGTIYIATGDPALVSEIGDPPIGVRVASFWDLEGLGPSLRAVVHHGGHGITTTCLASTLPAVVLPGLNPERLSNGERARSLGWGAVLHSPTRKGSEWGPSVDRTGQRPSWGDVREAVDGLRSAGTASADGVASPVDLVAALS
ncbi:hypothetical protein GRS96_15640 [Rathayibacter sp. VKM Ac-2803]|uniref:glycosyltransferase n=1 Tax=unclassified Rathayibacter TaxID=2609250 RepID=UPI001357FE33|nr:MULTISPECIES: nucleotide disphospho-sugar-binding domain-containing protein [unclassified Rathayibacter]MWV50705.1 hypothetical protein [Rathayibacter sp. VKM Ac-2803]MWV60754.1 hypothetical protein [Rathayibacter sp. VKM Ac-2754]